MLWLVVIAVLYGLPVAASAASINAQAINDAQFKGQKLKRDRIDPVTVKAQVLLDRARFSPGEIDGKNGENFQKALQAFAEANNLPLDHGRLTADVESKLNQAGGGDPVLTTYRITDADMRGPFLKRLPHKMEAMKALSHLGYTSPREELAEKFHMSQALLGALNPGAHFDQSGQALNVVNVAGKADKQPQVARIEIDKERQTLKAFNDAGDLMLFDPATVGSEEKPTPSGTLKVVSVDRNPWYRYDPNYRFKGVKSRKPFKIRPGPNNPVGTVWIGLSDKGYGIHGTAEPSNISKAESHGCVRLTNWDAERLAALVKKDVPVSFVDTQETAKAAGQPARQ